MSETPVIRPGKGKHAIEAVALGIEWMPPLDVKTMQFAREVHDSNRAVAEKVPGKREIPGVHLQMGTAVPGLAFEQNLLTDFTHANPAGVVDTTLSLRPDFFSCISTDYPGWKSVRSNLLSLLLPFVEAVLPSGATMGAVGLQYVDVFRWDVGAGNQLSNVLQSESEWLPRAVFKRPSFWHVHQGWFSDSPSRRRVLNNLNVDFSLVSDEYTLQITGQHRLQPVSFVEQDSSPLLTSDIEPALNHMHELNKELLLRLLTEDIREAIGLKKMEYT